MSTLKMKTVSLAGAFMLLLITAMPGSAATEQAPAAKEDARLPHPEVTRISCEDLKQLIDKKSDVVVVDTRDAVSYEDSHIPTAINVYYNPISDPNDRQMTLVALPMNRQIVIYCPWVDDEQSASLALEMRDLGYSLDKIRVLRGGSLRWEELDYPMVGTGVDEDKK